MKVIVVGSLNMDLVVKIPQIPLPGETLLGGFFNTFPGGKGANQAVAAARLGAEVTMIGCVGQDAFGQALLGLLQLEGIDIRYIKNHPTAATGVALIQVDDRGQNSIAVASGANFALTGADVEAALEVVGAFDALMMPLETPLETIYVGARVAARQGALVILNPAPAQLLEPDLLELVDLLVPNEYEIARMTGLEIQTTEDLTSAAAKLFEMRVKNLLVTLGSQGSLLYEGAEGQSFKIPAFPVQAVDTTAAGDCFMGGLAVGLCEGKTILEAARFASAASAISVTRAGAQPSLPKRAEVEEFLNRLENPKS